MGRRGRGGGGGAAAKAAPGAPYTAEQPPGAPYTSGGSGASAPGTGGGRGGGRGGGAQGAWPTDPSQYSPEQIRQLQQLLQQQEQAVKGGGRGGGKGSGGRGGHQHHAACGCGASDDEDDDDDDDSMDMEEEDMQHFADVCYSLVAYGDDALSELKWIEDVFKSVKDPHDRALLMPSMTNEACKEMHKRVKLNARFLAMLVESDEDANQFSVIPPTHQVQERNVVKARTVLRQFVRDWAEEGAAEREMQYGCLLRALQQHLPIESASAKSGPYARASGRPHVLCPGSGLARLPFEVARMGYSAQGNEFSYHMLQGSKWVLNESTPDGSHRIYPFVLSLEHRKDARDHMRGVKIPDVCPSEELCPNGVQISELSMCAGEFVEVYAPQEKEWDSVLTCFFLDTAKNVFLYIRTIAHIIRPGGIWANIGPLLYHYAEQSNTISIELSWEEIKPAIAKYFDFKEEDVREAYYTTNASGLFHTRYRCKYFVAIRNDRPASGKSYPVF